jgi:hypothetical protein
MLTQPVAKFLKSGVKKKKEKEDMPVGWVGYRSERNFRSKSCKGAAG